MYTRWNNSLAREVSSFSLPQTLYARNTRHRGDVGSISGKDELHGITCHLEGGLAFVV